MLFLTTRISAHRLGCENVAVKNLAKRQLQLHPGIVANFTGLTHFEGIEKLSVANRKN